MRLLVTGGTGTAGKAVVKRAVDRGHEVVVLSRHSAGQAETGVRRVQADLTQAGSLAKALEGIDAVIDCTNITTMSGAKATQFFVTEIRGVIQAGAAAGLKRYVLLSIVGIDALPLGYYKAKLAQEQALIDAAPAAGIAYAIARTTQFHDFAAQTLARSSVGPVALVPALNVQPVDVTEVAEHLLAIAESDTTGQAAELAGPLPETLTDMARRLVAHQGRRLRIVRPPLPPAVARANRARALIPLGGQRGRITYADWLSRRPSS
jgi:uncharacterized protein YbjT (DUF2867 family)